MRNIVLFHKLKDAYGPMAESIIQTGIDVGSFQHDLSDYDNAVLFCNDPALIGNLRNGHTKIGWWMNDMRPPEHLPMVDVDFIFLCNKGYLKDYEEKYQTPTFYAPQCGIDTHFPSEEPINWDILFIGNFSTQWHIGRKEILDTFKDSLLNVKVITGEFYTKTQKHLYKNTPISLAISPQVEGYTSNRLYNILSSGGFCLTLWFPGIEDLFENKKHLVWFETAEEGVELAQYYLENPEKRKEIAEAGQKLYQERHTAKHRLDFMFDTMSNSV